MKSADVTPVRLRPATERAIGTTAFFRNRTLIHLLLEQLKNHGQKHYSVLFHACSIGAEVYAFAIQYHLGGYSSDFTIDIHATDLEQGFIDYAQNGCYPADILTGMSPQERSFFAENGRTVNIAEQLTQSIDFLPACSFVDFTAEQPFDVVFLLNTLVYVPSDKQSMTIDKIAQYNKRFLVTSGFHMDSIKTDLSRNHYRPILAKQRSIHDAWLDRRVAVNSNDLGPGIYANWRLPPFSKIADFEYKYCALFLKQNA